jgi:carbon-monoxide dehydrogenase large subunit
LADIKSIGKPVTRIEGPLKVTGKAKFAADISLPNMLWGKVLRSPFPHAKIIRIDTQKAKELIGVRAIITGREFPHYIGRWKRDLPVLAIDKVRFIGERVAAVAADTVEIAEEALSLIEIEYAELPSVFKQMDAIKPGCPLVHDNPHSYENSYNNPEAPDLPNLCAYSKSGYGNFEKSILKADKIFENTFITSHEHQGYIEPHACVAWVRPSGKSDIWASNKSPWIMRMQLATALGIDPETIRANMVNVGGDFGGKGSPMDMPVAYLLSRESGNPVKMVMTYTEELLAGNPRHATEIKVTTGVNNNGQLIAMKVEAFLNSGAYGAFKPSGHIDLHGIHQAGNCYRFSAVEIHSYMIYTNTVPQGHMRSPGAPQVTFAIESQLDIISNELNLNPATFRLNNIVQENDEQIKNLGIQNVRAKQTLEKALEAAKWYSKSLPNVGRGIAMYERMPGAFGESAIRLTLKESGHITIHTGISDPGQGSLTILQQIVADVLKIELQFIHVKPGSTDLFDLESGVGGSRTTNVTGHAAFKAAIALNKKIETILKDSLGKSYQTKEANFHKLAKLALQSECKPIEVSVNHVPVAPNVTSYTAQIAEVLVDPQTGKIKVERFITAHDVGTIINPVGHQGQIEGGVIQGLGHALMEELLIEDGKPLTLHMGDYKIPNIKDIPKLVTVLLEEPVGVGPYNVKSIGEGSNVAPPAAIANAVADAVGIRIFSLPITSEKVWATLNDTEDPTKSI